MGFRAEALGLASDLGTREGLGSSNILRPLFEVDWKDKKEEWVSERTSSKTLSHLRGDGLEQV